MTELTVVMAGVIFVILLFTNPCLAVALLIAATLVSRVMKK
jgi:hypothetical protein